MVRADAADRVGARQACRGEAVVYHAVNVPYPAWPETLPPVMDGLIDAAGTAGAPPHVFAVAYRKGLSPPF